jgi:hypothetical protein
LLFALWLFKELKNPALGWIHLYRFFLFLLHDKSNQALLGNNNANNYRLIDSIFH